MASPCNPCLWDHLNPNVIVSIVNPLIPRPPGSSMLRLRLSYISMLGLRTVTPVAYTGTDSEEGKLYVSLFQFHLVENWRVGRGVWPAGSVESEKYKNAQHPLTRWNSLTSQPPQLELYRHSFQSFLGHCSPTVIIF
jgi:hypothetical protein